MEVASLLDLGDSVFHGWPEEFLFRGLLQNMLARSTKSEMAGWWTASVLFGFSQITNMGFPNWRYVILASIAGLFYGWTWRRTGSIFASAIVHAWSMRFGTSCFGLCEVEAGWKPQNLRELCPPALLLYPYLDTALNFRAFSRIPRPSFEYSFSKWTLTSR